jgi:hypothetical protein
MAQLQVALAPLPVPVVTAHAGATRAMPAASAASPQSFAAALRAASASSPGQGGGGIVALAQQEVGQAEQPPGSNDSPRIAEYRRAVPGGPVGPWCAYFASWVAQQNGTPLGEQGQGFARVDDVYAWAQRTGRAVPNGAGVTPQPGDLVIWDEHMGIVESVLPDGSVKTIEGNSSDQVSQRTYSPGAGGALGFVRLS